MPAKPKKIDSVASKIDELGRLKIEAATIEAKINEIKEWLRAQNVEKAEGTFYKVSFTSFTTKRIDWNAIQNDYDIPVKNYETETSSVRMNVSAK